MGLETVPSNDDDRPTNQLTTTNARRGHAMTTKDPLRVAKLPAEGTDRTDDEDEDGVAEYGRSCWIWTKIAPHAVSLTFAPKGRLL